MAHTLRRGAIAGAVGTLVLDAATYLDMALRGRPASDLPGQVAEAGLERLGVSLTGDAAQRSHRRTALGSLSGTATGLATGVVVSVARKSGLRLSPVTGTVATGALAMAVSDGTATALGLTDPTSWRASDWAYDVLPHLAYGAATHATLRGLERRDPTTLPVVRASGRLVLRSLALGVATGSRSSLGLAAAAHGTGGSLGARVRRTSATLAVGAELVADKQPATPSRLHAQGLVPRLGAAAAGATALARRQGMSADLPIAAAAAGAAVGSYAGAAWRAAWTGSGRPDWQAAVIEDATALLLAVWAVRRPR